MSSTKKNYKHSKNAYSYSYYFLVSNMSLFDYATHAGIYDLFFIDQEYFRIILNRNITLALEIISKQDLNDNNLKWSFLSRKSKRQRELIDPQEKLNQNKKAKKFNEENKVINFLLEDDFVNVDDNYGSDLLLDDLNDNFSYFHSNEHNNKPLTSNLNKKGNETTNEIFVDDNNNLIPSNNNKQIMHQSSNKKGKRSSKSNDDLKLLDTKKVIFTKPNKPFEYENEIYQYDNNDQHFIYDKVHNKWMPVEEPIYIFRNQFNKKTRIIDLTKEGKINKLDNDHVILLDSKVRMIETKVNEPFEYKELICVYDDEGNHYVFDETNQNWKPNEKVEYLLNDEFDKNTGIIYLGTKVNNKLDKVNLIYTNKNEPFEYENKVFVYDDDFNHFKYVEVTKTWEPVTTTDYLELEQFDKKTGIIDLSKKAIKNKKKNDNLIYTKVNEPFEYKELICVYDDEDNHYVFDETNQNWKPNEKIEYIIKNQLDTKTGIIDLSKQETLKLISSKKQPLIKTKKNEPFEYKNKVYVYDDNYNHYMFNDLTGEWNLTTDIEYLLKNQFDKKRGVIDPNKTNYDISLLPKKTNLSRFNSIDLGNDDDDVILLTTNKKRENETIKQDENLYNYLPLNARQRLNRVIDNSQLVNHDETTYNLNTDIKPSSLKDVYKLSKQADDNADQTSNIIKTKIDEPFEYNSEIFVYDEDYTSFKYDKNSDSWNKVDSPDYVKKGQINFATGEINLDKNIDNVVDLSKVKESNKKEPVVAVSAVDIIQTYVDQPFEYENDVYVYDKNLNHFVYNKQLDDWQQILEPPYVIKEQINFNNGVIDLTKNIDYQNEQNAIFNCGIEPGSLEEFGQIDIDNVSYFYPGNTVPSLDNISFKITRGAFHVFAGENGAGKSTMIKILLGFMEGYEGVISINKRNVIDFPIIKRLISYVPDVAVFPSFFTTFQYLCEITKLTGSTPATIKSKVSYLLKQFQVPEIKNKNPNRLSMGQKKKVLLVRALLERSKVLILDEPAANLDPTTKIQIFDLLKGLQRKGVTIFISTHLLDDIKNYATHLTLISKGKILYTGAVTAQSFENISKKFFSERSREINPDEIVDSVIEY